MAKPKYKLSDTRNIGIMAHMDPRGLYLSVARI